MKECPTCRCCFADRLIHCRNDGALLVPTIAGDGVLDGRYELKRRLGQGGMGSVYEARHSFLKTVHAVKVISPEFLEGHDPEFVRRFRQEAMAAANIRHRNVIRVTDFGIANGTMPFLVMDFIRGILLHQILTDEKVLPPERALEIIEPVALGVDAAHRLGIVHRDLKPLNIIIEEGLSLRDAVKVLDFGLAKIKAGELLGSFVAAKSSGVMGSPFYMAPEQWSDAEFDARTDIYSLGIILYQMLAGDVPFKGPSAPSIMKKHLMDEPPRFDDLGASVHPRIEAVVRHALQKDPDRRPESAKVFVEELHEAVEAAAAEHRLAQAGATWSDALTPETLEIHTPSGRHDSDAGTMPHDSGAGRQESERDRLLHAEIERAAAEARRRAEAEWLKREEEERFKREEAERLKREEEERLKREEEERLKREEAARLKREEEERLKREEAERLKREEEERLQREEAERLQREEAERQRREAEERRRKELEEQKRRALEEERLKAEAEQKRKAEEERQRKELEEQKRQEEEARERAEEEARLRAAEEERLREEARRAEEERLQREEEERLKREEQERLKREEAERLKREEAARLKREEAERLKREEERLKREEAERLEREEAERLKREEEERLRLEVAARLQREAEERLKREAEERRRQEAEAERRRQEELKRQEEARVRAAAEAERQRREEEWRQQQEQQRRQEEEQRRAAAAALALETEGPAEASDTARAGDTFTDTLAAVDAGVAQRNRFIMIALAAAFVLFVGVAGLFIYFRSGTNRQPPRPAENRANVNANGNAGAPRQGAAVDGGRQPAGPDLVNIAGGRFMMGRSDVPDVPDTFTQYPAHQITVEPFRIDRTEVTNEEYADFVRETGHAAPRHWNGKAPPAGTGKLPVVNVSFNDAQAFAQWRSKRDGVAYRLPREEEWEFAARGPGNHLYPWGNNWADDRAKLDGKQPSPVGSHPRGAAEGTGVLDLIGNVWEWTSSEASVYPGNDKLVLDEKEKGWIVVRGGSYRSMDAGAIKRRGGREIPAALRQWLKKETRNETLGFRLVCPLP